MLLDMTRCDLVVLRWLRQPGQQLVKRMKIFIHVADIQYYNQVFISPIDNPRNFERVQM